MVRIDVCFITHPQYQIMEHLLGKALIIVEIPFVITTIYFGSKKGHYYESEHYKGNGTAH